MNTNITTTAFISESQRQSELKSIQLDANKIIESNYNKNKTSSLANINLKDIPIYISNSITGFWNDLYIKPDDTNWIIYIINIIKKEQRYAYFGVLLVLFVIIKYVFD